MSVKQTLLRMIRGKLAPEYRFAVCPDRGFDWAKREPAQAVLSFKEVIAKTVKFLGGARGVTLSGEGGKETLSEECIESLSEEYLQELVDRLGVA